MLLTWGMAILGVLTFVLAFVIQPLLGIGLIFAVGGALCLAWKPIWGTLGYVFAVGFVAFFNLPITQEGLKLSSVILLCTLAVVFALMIIRRDWTLLRLPFSRPEHILLLLFWAICFVSMMKSENVGQAIKYLKMFSYPFLAYFLVLFTVKTVKNFELMVLTAVGAGVAIGLFGLMEINGESVYVKLGNRSLLGAQLGETIEKTSMQRINGMAADGDLHGGYMGVMCMLTIFIFFKSRSLWLKALFSAAIVLCFVNVFGAAARGAVLGFCIMSIVWFIAWDGKLKFAKAAVVGGLAFLIVSTLVTTTDLHIKRVYSEPRGTAAKTIDLRLNDFLISMNMFTDDPILGKGPAGYKNEYRDYAYRTSPTARKILVPDSLNLYTEVLVNTGLIGASVFTLFLFFIVKRLLTMVIRLRGSPRALALSLLAAFSGYSVFVCTSGHLVDQVYWMPVIFASVFHEIMAPQLYGVKSAADGDEERADKESAKVADGPGIVPLPAHPQNN